LYKSSRSTSYGNREISLLSGQTTPEEHQVEDLFGPGLDLKPPVLLFPIQKILPIEHSRPTHIYTLYHYTFFQILEKGVKMPLSIMVLIQSISINRISQLSKDLPVSVIVKCVSIHSKDISRKAN